MLISDRLWRRRFDGKANAIGKTLRIGASAYSIVGIMPPSFQFPDRNVDLWCPSPMDAPYAQSRESTWFTAVGRLKPGTSLEQARADLAAVQNDLGRQYPKTDAEIKAVIVPLKDATVGATRKSLWILFSSVSLLLLIACTNIAALLLSRATGRQHEISAGSRWALRERR
jgi:putative ABC transport system permease protein